MKIVASAYSCNRKGLEIFLAGCKKPHCKNCCNPDLWDFNIGTNYKKELPKIKNKIIEFDSMIDNILIVGGCPLDQNHDELLDFLKKLNTLDKEIFLFTRYSLGKVPYYIRKQCAYIKCGRYIPSLTVDNNIRYGITLATSNQKIYKKGKDY